MGLGGGSAAAVGLRGSKRARGIARWQRLMAPLGGAANQSRESGSRSGACANADIQDMLEPEGEKGARRCGGEGGGEGGKEEVGLRGMIADAAQEAQESQSTRQSCILASE